MSFLVLFACMHLFVPFVLVKFYRKKNNKKIKKSKITPDNLIYYATRDAVRLRYGLPLTRLPSNCGCSKPYNVQDAISCKIGGFVTLRHNELRDIAEMLEEVTSDVKVEPALQPLSGEEIKGNQSDEARSDISARGFWIRGRRAFFDIRVLDPNAQCHQSKTLRKCYEINKKAKKERIQFKDFES